jgi:hypothetical protein
MKHAMNTILFNDICHFHTKFSAAFNGVRYLILSDGFVLRRDEGDSSVRADKDRRLIATSI